MGTGSLSCGRGVALTTHSPSSAEVKEKVELYLYSLSGTLPSPASTLHDVTWLT